MVIELVEEEKKLVKKRCMKCALASHDHNSVSHQDQMLKVAEV